MTASRSSAEADPTESNPSVGPDAADIRRYEPDDRDGFLDLYEAVWSRRPSDAWFAWRYEANPYIDETPVFVAEHDGEIVGARALTAFAMAVDETTVTAFHPAEPLVHPDHRDRELRRRLVEHSIDHYTDSEPAFVFSFPGGEASQEALDAGHRMAGVLPKYYRIQNPNVYVGDKLAALPGPAASALGFVSPLVARGYHALVDRRAPTVDGFDVDRRTAVPSRLLADLYGRAVPPSIHAVRDEEFYDWRFSNPDETYVTYVATRSGEPVAAVVVADHTDGDPSKAELFELAPLAPTAHRDAALTNILGRIVEDFRSADLLTTVGTAFPDDVLEANGLRRDDRFPLSKVSTQMSLVVSPLTGANEESSWTIGSVDLTDEYAWRVTYCECATW